MKKIFILILFSFALLSSFVAKPPVKILVVTGGHGYNKEAFNEMLKSLGNSFTYEVVEFPDAFRMFLPENRSSYDVLLFYHMWQKITPEQQEAFASCISSGKPVVALHHSICAFDDWEEYWRIIGGKYFHKPTMLDGKEYPACSYIHDIHFKIKVADKKHPVTKGINDFEIFDETYKGYWVDSGVRVLLTTDEPSSTHVVGWAKTYGKARIVVLQSGHDTPTFQNETYRRLLRQALEWVIK